MSFLANFFALILSPWVWVPVVIILSFLTWRNNRRVATEKPVEGTLLVLEIPKANDKSELAAEQLFASLHGILRDEKDLKESGGAQEHLSFEIASVNGQIRFYVWTPKNLRNFVEGQIYSQYPTVQIHEADEDYVAHERQHNTVLTSEITLIDKQYIPIKTFQNFEVDPLAGITGTLAKLEDTGEELWVQILVRPIKDSWHKESDKWIKSVQEGKSGLLDFNANNIGEWFKQVFEALWKAPEPGESGSKSSSGVELSTRDKTRVDEAQKKATKLGYQVKIRAAYLGNNKENARLQMQALLGTFKQYNSTNLNGLKAANQSFDKESLGPYRKRLFVDDGFILNIEELASIFHLPHTNVETPNIVWASTKTAEPPSKLPIITGNESNDEQISAFGMTNFRGINHQFGMLRYDRSRHIYIIGQTGAGKSGLLELFALSDVYHNQGYAIIDPHGDFAVSNMKFIPNHRIKDVIYFNPADTANPVGFNPLEVYDENMKSNVSSEVVGVLKRMFGDSWGPRLEYILRYTILALLDRPETTMLDITRMLTDKKFRKETLDYCQDTVVLQFWKQEFGQWGERQVNEAIAPVLNKVGAFTANPIIRNIIGQPKSTFNIRQIMDEGKILIVNLSKGLIGEDNAGILGSFLVTKVQLAAMSRSDIADVRDRRPFYLYVDEFQNFATDSFATILSEARKYGLNLTVANQYISQMTETVRDAVFGNVGTMISFRVSAEDAEILAKQFKPNFEAEDLLQMHNRNFIINMVINGEKTPAFSASTLNLPPPNVDNSAYIIENSRQHYSRSREDVASSIDGLIKPPSKLTTKNSTTNKFNKNDNRQKSSQNNNQNSQKNNKLNDKPNNQQNKPSNSQQNNQQPSSNNNQTNQSHNKQNNQPNTNSSNNQNKSTEKSAQERLSEIQDNLRKSNLSYGLNATAKIEQTETANKSKSEDTNTNKNNKSQTEQPDIQKNNSDQKPKNMCEIKSYTRPDGEVVIDLHGKQRNIINRINQPKIEPKEVVISLSERQDINQSSQTNNDSNNSDNTTNTNQNTNNNNQQNRKKPRRRRRKRKNNSNNNTNNN